jgi:hypothetical protein
MLKTMKKKEGKKIATRPSLAPTRSKNGFLIPVISPGTEDELMGVNN